MLWALSTTPMNVYLACTVRGDRGGVQAARAMCRALERRGLTVLTRHLLEDDVDTREAALDESQVFTRDLAWLERADLLVAEASGSSFGVGFEVGYVLARAGTTGQRVLLFYDRARRHALSRLLLGVRHPACTVHEYDDAEEMTTVLERYLGATTA
jgi:hypothetical protein